LTIRVLVVTLGILALATLASAECAWVLWEAYPGHQSKWKVITAATSHDKCEEKATHFTRSNLEQIQRGRMSSTLVYECLPDSIDPRGPRFFSSPSTPDYGRASCCACTGST